MLYRITLGYIVAYVITIITQIVIGILKFEWSQPPHRSTESNIDPNESSTTSSSSSSDDDDPHHHTEKKIGVRRNLF